jgi:DNA-binding transcriptional regulator GbsR (MarR family)
MAVFGHPSTTQLRNNSTTKQLPHMSPLNQPIVRKFIEDAGNTTQSLGVGRVIGQIFAYLYFSEEPRGLDDMKEALGISKGSASMGVRQLEQWGAVQRVWVKGDRKDYYTANDYFGQIIRNIATDLMGKRLAALGQSLDSAEIELSSCQVVELLSESPQGQSLTTKQLNNSTTDFLRTRVRRLRDFQQKVNKTWNNPIVKLMLK